MNVDHISLSTTPIFLWKGTELVSQGTGFYYASIRKDQKVLYLVTNYHVLTGSAPEENKSPIGDSIAFHFHRSDENTGDVKVFKYKIFTPHGLPVWVTNSSYPTADLAVIPLSTSFYNDCKVLCISDEWAKVDLLVKPTTSVTLVGYPYGFYDKKNSLPIWKTGTVASEPKVDFENKPLFLIDVSAFPGMSGSPVFAISHGTHENEDGAGVSIGGARKFLGVYSSMQMLNKKKYLEEIAQKDRKVGIVDSESLEIGYVWKSKIILDTINSIDIGKYLQERKMPG